LYQIYEQKAEKEELQEIQKTEGESVE